VLDRAVDADAAAGIVERIAPQAVAQRRWRDALQVLDGHGLGAIECGECPRSAHQRQFAAQAVGAEREAQLGRFLEQRIADHEVRQLLAGADDAAPHLVIVLLPAFDEGGTILLEGIAAADDGDARRQILRRADLDRQAEAIEQLRPQFALFRIAAAHQHEARGMAHAEAFALDHVLAAGGDIDQQIDQMVFEQIDLVDIQEAAVGARQQAGSKALTPCDSAFSRSSAPTTRSSVAPSGRSTTGTGTRWVFFRALPSFARLSAQASLRSSGAQ